MKNLLIITCFLICGALSAQTKTNKERAQLFSDNMEKQLALTPAEKVKVYEVMNNKLGVLDKCAANENQDAARNSRMLEKRKFILEIKEVLTEEKYMKWQKIKSTQLVSFRKGEKVENPVFDEEMERVK
jgi:hypothetical protein